MKLGGRGADLCNVATVFEAIFGFGCRAKVQDEFEYPPSKGVLKGL